MIIINCMKEILSTFKQKVVVPQIELVVFPLWMHDWSQASAATSRAGRAQVRCPPKTRNNVYFLRDKWYFFRLRRAIHVEV
jgi:hypothetical protein